MTRPEILPKQTLFSLTSTKRLVNALEETEDLRLLKGATLLYPVIVFNTDGGPYESILEFLSKGLGSDDRQAIQSMCLPAAKLEGYVGEIRASELLAEVLRIPGANRQAVIDRFVETERTIEAKGGYTFEDPFSEPNPLLILFLIRRLHIPYYEAVTRVTALQELVRQLAARVDTEEPLEMGVGDLSNLSWEAILDLRRSKFIDSFRKFMFTHASHQRVLEEKIQTELWSVVGRFTPSTTASFVQRLGALIPTGIVPNPYAVIREAKEGVKEWQLYKEYGWLFFLHEAREKMAHHPDS